MIPWRDLLYDFPDDAGRTLLQVINLLSDQQRRDLIRIPFGGYRLRDVDPMIAVYLLLAVPDLEHSVDHPFLNPGDLYVPDHRRAGCDRVLAAQSSTGHKWSTLECISGCDPALIGFDQLWQHNVLPIL